MRDADDAAARRRRRRGEGSSERGRKRRSRTPFWALLAVSVLAVAAAVLSSRRIHPLDDEEWDDLLDEDLPPGRRSRFPSVRLRVDGPRGELAVDDGGSGGLPVVLVHGLGGSAEQWRPQLDHLRAERRALALDLRGHGRSDPALPTATEPATDAYGVGAYADDVAAVVDDLGLERFVLAGHSLGGSVVAEYARRHPEQVAGLLLVDPNGDQSRGRPEDTESFLSTLRADPAGEIRFHFQQILIGAEPGIAERVLADLATIPGEAIVGSLESIASYEPVAALSGYPGPKLSVIGDLNTLPISLHRLMPELPVVLISGTSHWLMLDRPEGFNRTLDDFLARVESAAG